jgi:hypothetical protein
MNRCLLVLIMIVSAFGADCSILSVREHTGPKIDIKEEQYDLGKVVQGQQAVHVFEFRNAGDEVLVIQKVLTSCGCTAAPVSSDRLEPGETGQIRVSVNTEGRSGRLAKYVTVYSNDGATPSLSFAVMLVVEAVR